MKRKRVVIFGYAAAVTMVCAADFDEENMRGLWQTMGGGAAAGLCAASLGTFFSVWCSELSLKQKIKLTTKLVVLGTFFGGGFSLMVPFFYTTLNYAQYGGPAVLVGGAAGGVATVILGDAWSDNLVQRARLN